MTRLDRRLAEQGARRDSPREVYEYYGALEGQDHEESTVPEPSSNVVAADGGDPGG